VCVCYDVRLSHLNKDYLYLLTVGPWGGGMRSTECHFSYYHDNTAESGRITKTRILPTRAFPRLCDSPNALTTFVAVELKYRFRHVAITWNLHICLYILCTQVASVGIVCGRRFSAAAVAVYRRLRWRRCGAFVCRANCLWSRVRAYMASEINIYHSVAR